MWAEHHDEVRPEWLDTNGHMNLAYYVVVFDRGTDAWLTMAGLGAEHHAAGFGIFAVEAHTSYRHEVRLGDPLVVRSALVGAEGRRIHLQHEMRSHDRIVAVQEVLFLHTDLQTRRSVALPAAQAVRLAALTMPPEPWLGRHVGQPR